ncbi:hypothetical protein TNCV_2090941 [Trichonephila clavipes]|nr:hypothetical protein TNCV_2090941 [Trichonephila clavipes]
MHRTDPNLSRSDFHLFRYLKHGLGGKRFSDNEVKSVVNSWLSDQTADFFEEDFENLVLSENAALVDSEKYPADLVHREFHAGTQPELSDLIQDLYLPESESQVLRTRLSKWNL